MKIKQINTQIKEYAGYIYASDSKRFYGDKGIVKVYIDRIDFAKCRQYGWYITKKGYVYTMINNHTVFIHRFLFDNIDKDIVVDHHDGNKLNNVRNNLILMTNEENLYKAWKVQGLYNTNKPVYMKDAKTDWILKEFISTREAEKYLRNNGFEKARQGNISSACTGRLRTYCGYIWTHYKEQNALYGEQKSDCERYSSDYTK